MPRKPRFYIPNVAVHVVHRGHNRDVVFSDDGDFQAYSAWLYEAADQHGCAIHAYVLMNNHIHLSRCSSFNSSYSIDFFWMRTKHNNFYIAVFFF